MKTYKILTFLIMILGKWRQKASCNEKMGLIKDSPLIRDTILFRDIAERKGILVKCCDCGLEHRFFKEGEELKAQPFRPINYDYAWRNKS